MIFINCDGGSRGNPGPAAIGLVIWDSDHKKLEEHGERIGTATNNVAEYKSLIRSLELASDPVVHVSMDSELVIKQVTDEYRVKKQHLIPLFQRVKELEKKFDKVTYEHVFRTNTYQSQADRMVNEALDAI